MRVYGDSASLPATERGCVLTIGNFDGVHVGHQTLLRAVVDRARHLGLPAAVYTFDPHPRRVLYPERDEPRLMTPAQLEAELEALGLDVLIREPFTPEFAAHSAEAFLSQIIHRRIGPAEIFVGRDFHFGKGRGGSDDTLVRIGPDLGIRVVVVPQVRNAGGDVSSTRIRRALARGDVEEARECLGRPHALRGRVVRGERRGQQLGFPTANLEPENELIPDRGVYATTFVVLEGGRPAGRPRPSVTNVGTRPTFDAGQVLVETHLLDFAGDLYDRRVEVRFHARIRAERRFPGADALKAQIARDADRAAELLRGEGA